MSSQFLMTPVVNQQDAVFRMHELGYFGEIDVAEIGALALTSPKVKDAVEKYRDFNGLPAGDSLDDTILEQMQVPRCGVPDFQASRSRLCEWPGNNPRVMAFQQIGALRNVTAEQVAKAWSTACQSWNLVCGIQMQVSDKSTNANIHAKAGRTQGNVLAWSYLPCNASMQTKLDQLYGSQVNWSYNLLLNVMIHEIGHALGLDHGPTGSIMQPTAPGNILKPQAWDIQQVKARYGEPLKQPDPAPAPAPAPAPVPTPIPQGIEIVVSSTLPAGRYRLVPITSNQTPPPNTGGNPFSMG